LLARVSGPAGEAAGPAEGTAAVAAGGASAPGQAASAVLFSGDRTARVQQVYDFGPVYQSGIDGSGETIAIVDAYGSPTIQSDLETFRQTVEQGAYGADQTPNLQVISPPGLNQVAVRNPVQGAAAADWASEVSMDVELAHAAAPGAKILLVATPNNGSDLYMGVNQVIDQHLANQISLSFGSPEVYTPASERRAIDQMFEQAAAEGINVFVSSGDDGDYSPVLGYRDVSFPASDPNVIAVGGSTLFTDPQGNYAREVEWGDVLNQVTYPDGTVVSGPVFWFGTGGGSSNVFTQPSWQTGAAGPGSTAHRQVPDVAFDSDPLTGFAIVQNGVVQPGWGGTSAAAPQWAAICALANQAHRQQTGSPLPFINPILYQSGQGALHDVLHGTAHVQLLGASSGRLYDVTLGEDTSLSAGPGWDNATGLGTPDVAKVVNLMAGSR
ncbi:MAG: S53 family peptidase, partial [Alicyclobacillus sp.]|nr:S53 family peptidase [Alicyclobacillus sp.]